MSCAVANVGAANPEDDILGDIRGVVRDPLQIPSDGKSVQRLNRPIRMRLHEAGKRGESLVVHAVDFIIGLKHVFRELRIALYE